MLLRLKGGKVGGVKPCVAVVAVVAVVAGKASATIVQAATVMHHLPYTYPSITTINQLILSFFILSLLHLFFYFTLIYCGSESWTKTTSFLFILPPEKAKVGRFPQSPPASF